MGERERSPAGRQTLLCHHQPPNRPTIAYVTVEKPPVARRRLFASSPSAHQRLRSTPQFSHPWLLNRRHSLGAAAALTQNQTADPIDRIDEDKLAPSLPAAAVRFTKAPQLLKQYTTAAQIDGNGEETSQHITVNLKVLSEEADTFEDGGNWTIDEANPKVIGQESIIRKRKEREIDSLEKKLKKLPLAKCPNLSLAPISDGIVAHFFLFG
nr:hypothetical protein Iba_chr06aCG5320 [Ipomoea batatas]